MNFNRNRQTSRVILHFLLIFTLIACIKRVPLVQAATAATITVNSTTDVISDDGQCSLREAITAANTDTAFGGCPAGSGADTITLPAGTYTLVIAGTGEDANASGDLDITSDITIEGAGADVTIIDAAQIDRVLHIASYDATVTLSDLTIQNGRTADGAEYYPAEGGGGVYNQGTLTIQNSLLSGNRTGNGGDSLDGYIAAGDGGDGGGIYNQRTLVILNSMLLDNYTGNGGDCSGDDSRDGHDGYGGGVYNVLATLTITNSTLAGNNTGSNGGGLWVYYGDTTLTNVTISASTAGAQGGGIHFIASTGAILRLRHCTITNNNAGDGGGIYVSSDDTLRLKNSIVAGNTDDSSDGSTGDCSGTVSSQGYNVVGDSTGCPSDGAGDQTTMDPRLGPLQDNGGGTDTHSLLSSSLALDVIPVGTNGCGTTYTEDQRGMTRPQASLCDSGAFETGYGSAELNVQGNGQTITDGDNTPDTTNHTDFDEANVNTEMITHTFSMTNTGLNLLNLIGTPTVDIAGIDADAFRVTTMPDTVSLAPNTSTTFQITFEPTEAKVYDAVVVIASNDADRLPFTFSIQGTGVDPSALSLLNLEATSPTVVVAGILFSLVVAISAEYADRNRLRLR